MLYTLNELEEELKISSRIIRGWLQKDLPYRQDGRGHIFVNGQDLAAWVATYSNLDLDANWTPVRLSACVATSRSRSRMFSHTARGLSFDAVAPVQSAGRRSIG
jgi:hypothetical protein